MGNNEKFNVEIVYTGMLNETVEAESIEEAEFEARDIAAMELSGILMNTLYQYRRTNK